MINKYDYKKIGSLIRRERNQISYSQSALGEYIGVTRQTIAKWERGEDVPQLSDLLKLCNLFECELGYLLGEFEGKTRSSTDIHEETGLKLQAVDNLKEARRLNMWFSLKALNELLSDDTLYILHLIGQYLTMDEQNTVEMPDRDEISKAEITGIQIDRELLKLRLKVQAEIQAEKGRLK